MKISKTNLKRIIQEELEYLLQEQDLPMSQQIARDDAALDALADVGVSMPKLPAHSTAFGGPDFPRDTVRDPDVGRPQPPSQRTQDRRSQRSEIAANPEVQAYAAQSGRRPSSVAREIMRGGEAMQAIYGAGGVYRQAEPGMPWVSGGESRFARPGEERQVHIPAIDEPSWQETEAGLAQGRALDEMVDKIVDQLLNS